MTGKWTRDGNFLAPPGHRLRTSLHSGLSAVFTGTHSMSTRIAFIGLGVMGYPMAGHLQRAGYQVTVYNRTTAKAEQWVAEYGGERADTPRDAARGASFIMS